MSTCHYIVNEKNMGGSSSQPLCGSQVLTPVQNARCMVRSFPYFPDTPAIALWVAAQEGDANARARLRSKGVKF